MSSTSTPLQAADLLRLGWTFAELRHLAEAAWTSSELDGPIAWRPFVRSKMEFLRLLAGEPVPATSPADGLPNSRDEAEQQLLLSLANVAAHGNTELAHAKVQLANALQRVERRLYRAWHGPLRGISLSRIPEPEPDQYEQLFERRRQLMQGARFPRLALQRVQDAADRFEKVLPVADRAAFNLGKTLAAATHATFTGPEYLQWPGKDAQSWKELVLLPRARQALATLSAEFLLDVRFDEQRLIRAGTPWMTLCDDVLKALDPQSADDKPYLGIERDPYARVLRRTGYDELKLSEIPWKLVRVLLTAGPRLSTRERLYRAWEGDPPSQDALEKQLSRLRDELNKINVSVENQQGDGWRLVDNSTTAAS